MNTILFLIIYTLNDAPTPYFGTTRTPAVGFRKKKHLVSGRGELEVRGLKVLRNANFRYSRSTSQSSYP